MTEPAEKKKSRPAKKPAGDALLGCSTPIPLRTGKAVDLQGQPHEIPPTQLQEIEKLAQSCESSLTDSVREEDEPKRED